MVGGVTRTLVRYAVGPYGNVALERSFVQRPPRTRLLWSFVPVPEGFVPRLLTVFSPANMLAFLRTAHDLACVSFEEMGKVACIATSRLN